jgi:hypothetical protein
MPRLRRPRQHRQGLRPDGEQLLGLKLGISHLESDEGSRQLFASRDEERALWAHARRHDVAQPEEWHGFWDLELDLDDEDARFERWAFMHGEDLAREKLARFREDPKRVVSEEVNEVLDRALETERDV